MSCLEAWLLDEIARRFRAPEKGGRLTDPQWLQHRQVPMTDRTLRRLESLAATVTRRTGRTVHPMQLGALLIEHAMESLTL